MEYLIKCPNCDVTDLVLNDKIKKKTATAESYHCNACNTDFSVKYFCRNSKTIIERNWKKIVLAAVILV